MGVFALISETLARSPCLTQLLSQYGCICAIVIPDGPWRRRIPDPEWWDFKFREEMETLSCRVLKGGLYGGDLGLENVPKACLLEDATEKTQHVIEISKCCVTGVGAIKA